MILQVPSGALRCRPGCAHGAPKGKQKGKQTGKQTGKQKEKQKGKQKGKAKGLPNVSQMSSKCLQKDHQFTLTDSVEISQK